MLARAQPIGCQSSALKRPAQLAPECRGCVLVGEPVSRRLTVLGKMRCPKHEIEQRQQPAEVLVQRFPIRGMVPAMKCGARNYVADPAVTPAHVAVDEDWIDGQERAEHTGNLPG